MSNYFFCCITVLLKLFGWSSSTLYAQNYEIPEITVKAEILENGTVQIEEQRTYSFDGSFSWADYTLPAEGFSSINNIRVSESDSKLINQNIRVVINLFQLL